MSNANARKRNGTGSPFCHQATEAGSKSEGFFFSSEARFLSSAVLSSDEEGDGRDRLSNFFFGAGAGSEAAGSGLGGFSRGLVMLGF